MIETISGQVISGDLQTRDTNQVVVVDAQGKQTSIPIGEVDFIERQDKSLMPDLQLKDLTAQQVADLVEFFKSAK